MQQEHIETQLQRHAKGRYQYIFTQQAPTHRNPTQHNLRGQLQQPQQRHLPTAWEVPNQESCSSSKDKKK